MGYHLKQPPDTVTVTVRLTEQQYRQLLADNPDLRSSVSFGADVARYDAGNGIIAIERTSAWRIFTDRERQLVLGPSLVDLFAEQLDRMESEKLKLAAFVNECLAKPVPIMATISTPGKTHGPRNRKERLAAKAKPKGRRIERWRP